MKKTLAILLLAGVGVAGCVAVPVAEPVPGPGVYVSPPTVVVQPYAYYGYGYYGSRYHGGYRYRHW